jgi:CDP-2,3-bis-(O-geranylgeranyl)-sn-glycerol synthase
MEYIIILQALWLIIPAYIANASAVIVGGGPPIDFGHTWKDGRRILGDGKTWRGLLSGSFIGMTSGFGLVVAADIINSSDYGFLHLSDFGRFPVMIPIIFSICFGALSGDIIESFFKRRLGIDRGENWIPFDQIDFILGVLLFSFIVATILFLVGLTKDNWFLSTFSIWHILTLLIVTPFFHLFANKVFRRTHTTAKRK